MLRLSDGKMDVRENLARMAGGKFLSVLLIVATLVAMGFGVVSKDLDGPLLDLVHGPAANRARLAAMSADQRALHLWITCTLDMVYPFAYGGALANLAARFARRRKLLVALPALIMIAADLCENLLIVLILNGNLEVTPLKSAVTEVKWTLFVASALLAIVLAAAAALRHRVGTPLGADDA